MGTETKRGKLDHILIENTCRDLRLYLLSSMCVCIYIIVSGGGVIFIFILSDCEILHVKCSFAFSGNIWLSFL